MAKLNQPVADKLRKDNVADELDEINARTRRRGTDRIRRKIEATLEAKAKRRRSREAPASSAWKK